MNIGCVLMSFVFWGELLFFISCTVTMLDGGGPRGFSMQLFTLGVLNKDLVSCWKINALYSLFYACSYCQLSWEEWLFAFFLVIVVRYGKT